MTEPVTMQSEAMKRNGDNVPPVTMQSLTMSRSGADV